MSDIGPPSVGDNPWGATLNAYLASLEERILTLELASADHETRLTELEET